MNSFNTDEDTARIIQKYANHNIELMTFNQSRYPRVNKESLLPTPRSALEDKAAWCVFKLSSRARDGPWHPAHSNDESCRYPPGHGDLFDAITNSGLVDKLLAQGKEYLFVSNVDNLGAVVDMNILEHMHTNKNEVCDYPRRGTTGEYEG
jgi:UTP--glucose-1-phosphate uridylyltransferase